MSQSDEDRSASARRKAQGQFTSSADRESSLRRELESERARTAAKNARLRGLRLAKEAAEKAQADTSTPDQNVPAVKPQAAKKKVKRAPGY